MLDINLYKAILSSMTEGVVVLDKSGNIIIANSAIRKIFDLNDRELTGLSTLEVIRNYDLHVFLNEVLQAKKPMTKEIEMLSPVNKIFEIHASPFWQENGDFKGVVAVFYDITELRKLERIRSEFVANVSHELRTPLSSIKGYVETLLDGAINDSENNMKFLNIINEHTKRLDRLINDLLDLSKIETKRIELKLEVLNIKDTINKVISLLKTKTDEREITIETNIPEDLLQIKADKNKLEQVFFNLLDNAIKFNVDKGRITISVEILADKIRIDISDTGIGIPEKDLPRIFERFYRVDKTRSRELGGTGLGLSIIKHIVELHEGTVSVESKLNKGSKFSFTLPL